MFIVPGLAIGAVYLVFSFFGLMYTELLYSWLNGVVLFQWIFDLLYDTASFIGIFANTYIGCAVDYKNCLDYIVIAIEAVLGDIF